MSDERVERVLADAEKSLVELSSEAATQRDYDRATIILGIAREIGGLAGRVRIGASPAVAGVCAATSDPVVSLTAPVGPGHGCSTAQRSRRGRRAAYPQFFRDGSCLLKIGFSKREGEYHHKAPELVLFTLVEILSKTGARSHRFTMEDVIPQVGAALGNDVPSYQVYLCLSWVKSLGLIEQHGRQGYTAKASSELPQRVRARWEQLPPRATGGAS
jgi:hypothetical protein